MSSIQVEGSAVDQMETMSAVRTGVRALLLVHDVLVGHLLTDALALKRIGPVTLHLDSSSFIEAIGTTSFDVAIVEAELAEGLGLARRLRSRGVMTPLLVLATMPQRPPEDDLLALERVAVFDREHLDVGALAEAALVLARGSSAREFFAGEAEPPPTAVRIRLSPREREVLSLVARGMDNLKIAALIGVGERAVKTHVTALYRKLGCETRVELALRGIELGLRASDI